MHITAEAGFGISDENSVTLPRPHNRKCKRTNKPRGSAAPQWSEEETLILINVLYDDARKSGFNGSTISGPHWKEVLNEFFQISGKQDIDKSEEKRVRSKYQRLKRETKAFKDLISTSGYGWNPETNRSTCPVDIWENLLAQKGSKKDTIIKFRHKGLKHFTLLEEIFGKSFATGDQASYRGNPAYEEQFNDATTMDQETVELDGDLDDSENVHRPRGVNTGSGIHSGKRPMDDTSMGTDAATSACRKKSRDTSAEIHEVFKRYLAGRIENVDAKEKRKLEQESASEAIVITQLQFLVQNHNLPLDNFGLAVKELENSSVRKMFVHMADTFQVQWFNGLGKIWKNN